MLIGEIERGETEVLRVSMEEYKGRKYLDIRIYFADDAGEWKPTKKGVTVQTDRIADFIELINKALKAV